MRGDTDCSLWFVHWHVSSFIYTLVLAAQQQATQTFTRWFVLGSHIKWHYSDQDSCEAATLRNQLNHNPQFLGRLQVFFIFLRFYFFVSPPSVALRIPRNANISSFTCVCKF